MASNAIENAGGDQDEVSGPLVFSCTKCKTIVGDSFAFLCSSENVKTITLSAASNIQRTSELYTSFSDHDEGSTYFCFMCTGCQALLGRYYVTTSRDLDHIREKFTFNINEISSYELGKAQHGKLPEPMEQIAVRDSPIPNKNSLEEDVLKVNSLQVPLISIGGNSNFSCESILL
jgi:hypothetical protein